jgi:hypothetical protein
MALVIFVCQTTAMCEITRILTPFEGGDPAIGREFLRLFGKHCAS